VLVLSLLLFALALLELELAIVHQLADGGLCLGRNLHQIQTALFRNFQRFCRGHDTKLLTVITDEADFLIADLFVQLMRYVANTEAPPIKNKKRECS
jgi:hypothetical protein